MAWKVMAGTRAGVGSSARPERREVAGERSSARAASGQPARAMDSRVAGTAARQIPQSSPPHSGPIPVLVGDAHQNARPAPSIPAGPSRPIPVVVADAKKRAPIARSAPAVRVNPTPVFVAAPIARPVPSAPARVGVYVQPTRDYVQRNSVGTRTYVAKAGNRSSCWDSLVRLFKKIFCCCC